MLYVALTRAKRGLFVLLEPPAEKADPDKPSLANWLARSAGGDAQSGVIFQSGTPDWKENIAMMETEEPAAANRGLGAAVPRRGRKIPSGAKSKDQAPAHSPAGMRFGSEVHALLEGVAWADEETHTFPACDAGKAVAALLRNPALRDVFERQDREIELFREQAADAILDGTLLSGVIDRLHLHRDPAGTVARVEIIDFKTDAVKTPDELSVRYSGQMAAYRAAMGKIHPKAIIDCLLVSVRHAAVISL
jgi:ATP-dependent exoDNAse (exonuclease V) beta subunit